MENRIISATTYSQPFGDGQRVTALALEYDVPVDGASIAAEAFAVENRTIEGAYTAAGADGTAQSSGHYVILRLSKKDEDAKTVKSLRPRRAPGEPGGPGGAGGHGPGTPGFRGPHGLAKKREALAVSARQTGDIRSASGQIIPAGSQVVSSKEINELSDQFRQFRLDGEEYNLYIPENYDPQTRYPLVLFIGDASIAGKDARITLEQGVGALVWTTLREQAKHPCFVLAPVHYHEDPITNDDYECTEQLEVVKAMCDKVISQYSIDTSRVYTTGQSMGCMSSFELMYRYPDYFAAALCISGHWTRRKIADCAERGQKLWVILSELDDKGYPCVCEVRDILDKENIPYGWYEWDGRKDPDVLSLDARAAAGDGNTFRVTVYPGDSALRLGMEDEVRGGHPAGWCLSYRIEGVRDWLFSNSL